MEATTLAHTYELRRLSLEEIEKMDNEPIYIIEGNESTWDVRENKHKEEYEEDGWIECRDLAYQKSLHGTKWHGFGYVRLPDVPAI